MNSPDLSSLLKWTVFHLSLSSKTYTFIESVILMANSFLPQLPLNLKAMGNRFCTHDINYGRY